MEKLVIIINGKGGSGKDTLCELAAKHYKVKIISAITPIKDIAKANGWDGEKDEKSRKFLSDLKRIFIEYNDLPNSYLMSQYQEFIKDKETEILFAHIREADEIKKFKQQVKCACVTLLVKRPLVDSAIIGNDSDDKVDAMNYDYYFMNNESINCIEDKFVEFIAQLLKNEIVTSTFNWQSDFITKIQSAIKATSADDVYSCGMRNGMRWCVSLIDDKEPLYENCKTVQPEYVPVTAEDFARTMSETSVYSYMAWYSVALSLTEKQGFVICKRRTDV